MVIDMKVIGEMEKKKEKVFIIIIMVIEKWAIIQMIIKLENMSYLLQMEKSKLKFINKIIFNENIIFKYTKFNSYEYITL